MKSHTTWKKLGTVSLPVVIPVLLMFLPGPITSPPVVAEEGGDGKAVFLAERCEMCHSVSSVGIEAKTKSENMLGPDLAGVGSRHDAEWIHKYLLKEIEGDNGPHKKVFGGSDDDLSLLIDWLMEQ